MKHAIYIVIILFLIVINVLTLTSAKLHDALFRALSHFPLSTLIKNSPTKRYNRLSSESKARTKELSRQNNKLRAKRLSNQRTVKKLSQRIAARTVANISRNILSIPAETVPVLGVGLMLAVTVKDVVDGCNTMKDMDEILDTLGANDQASHTDEVCGQSVPSKEEVLSWIRVNNAAGNK